METLTGFITSKTPPVSKISAKTQKPFVLQKFKFLEDTKGEVDCSIFGTIGAHLMGQKVQFEAEHNAQYNQYGVKGSIIPLEAEPVDVPPVKNVTNVKTVLQQRPAPAPVVAPAPVPVEDAREDARAEAVQSVKANILSAIALKQDLGLETVDLIALSDMIGRTISAIVIGKQRK